MNTNYNTARAQTKYWAQIAEITRTIPNSFCSCRRRGRRGKDVVFLRQPKLHDLGLTPILATLLHPWITQSALIISAWL